MQLKLLSGMKKNLSFEVKVSVFGILHLPFLSISLPCHRYQVVRRNRYCICGGCGPGSSFYRFFAYPFLRCFPPSLQIKCCREVSIKEYSILSVCLAFFC